MKSVRWVIVFVLLWVDVGLARETAGTDSLPTVDYYSMIEFRPTDYGAHPRNWCMIEGDEAEYFFGNQTGILRYRPDFIPEWEWIPTPFLSSIRALAKDDEGRIYVGGYNEFGYLRQTADGSVSFVPLHHSSVSDFGQIWHISVTTHGIYFQAEDRIFRWFSGQFEIWQTNSKFQSSFAAFDKFYVREWGRGLLILKNGKLELVPNGDFLAQEDIISIIPYDDHARVYSASNGSQTSINIRPLINLILIGTRGRGLLLYDGHFFSEYHSNANAYLLQNELQHLSYYDQQTELYADNFFLATTKQGGLVIFDQYPDIKQVIDKKTGIPHNNLIFSYVDREGYVWLAHDDGLSRIHRNAMVWSKYKAHKLTVPERAEAVVPPLIAESGLPFLTNFSQKTYQAHGQNYQVQQDQRGIIYVANNDGILEYDGISWRKITLPAQATPRSLAIGPPGTIYVGADDELGCLTVTDESRGIINYQSFSEKLPVAVKQLGSFGQTIVMPEGTYYLSEKRLVRLPSKEATSDQISFWQPKGQRFVKAIKINDTLYLQDYGHGLCRMENGRLQLIGEGQKFAFGTIECILRFQAGELLIGTTEKGIFRYNEQGVIPFSTQADGFFMDNLLSGGVVLPDSTMVFSTQRGGVAIIDRQGRLHKIIDTSSGLQDNWVNNLFLDNEDGVWISLNRGISRLESNPRYSVYDDRLDLRGSIETVVRHDSRLYVGTNQGIYYLDTCYGALWKTRFQPVQGVHNYCWELLSTEMGLLAATNNGVYKIVDNAAEKINDFPAYSIHRSPHQQPNRVYVGLANGLASLEHKNNTWIDQGRVRLVDAESFETIQQEIRSIGEDEQGRLWLGTPQKGVLQTAGFGQANIAVKAHDSQSGLEGDGSAVFQFSDGLLFATPRQLYRFDNDRQMFVPDTTFGQINVTGLLDDLHFAEDKDGTIWHNFITGTLSAMPRNGSITTFPRLSRINLRIIYPDPDGVVWLGGSNGLIRLDTQFPEKVTIKHPVLFREIRITGDQLVYGGAMTDLGSPTRSITIKYADNDLRSNYVIPGFDSDAPYVYRFWLEGFDADWSGWTNRSEKEYTNLDKGHYTFHVRAKNVFGQESSPVSYQFRILPPWYESWWFYTLQIIMFVTLLLGSFILNRTGKYRTLSEILTFITIITLFELLVMLAEQYLENFVADIPLFGLLVNILLAISLTPVDNFLNKILNQDEKS